MKSFKTLIILFLINYWLPASSQEIRIISGTVTTLNDLPVSGIKVTAKKSLAATITDSLGGFVIACKPKDRLMFKSEVFSNIQRRINKSTSNPINVKLNFIPTTKNVDMAIGYGYISSDQRTQAIEYIERGNNYCNYLDVYDLIKAKFTGVNIMPDGCIIVRGLNTINGSNCAIYVVDGNKVDNIDYISTCDVKEISLLKDGTAAIYGSQSSNGVFFINLKDGKE